VETLVGLHAEIERVVGADDTAEALGSGDVAVLGTPRLVAWFEAATLTALHGHLSAGTTTVGTSVAVRHRRPSPVGAGVMVRARVVRHEGRRVEFAVEAESTTGGRLAEGSVSRALVERESFLGGL